MKTLMTSLRSMFTKKIEIDTESNSSVLSCLAHIN